MAILSLVSRTMPSPNTPTWASKWILLAPAILIVLAFHSLGPGENIRNLLGLSDPSTVVYQEKNQENHAWTIDSKWTIDSSVNLSNSSMKPFTNLKDLKILLYVTTHMSDVHKKFLKSCWSKAIEHSRILQSSDVTVYLNSKADRREADKIILNNTLGHNNLTIHERKNTGYQEGANDALKDAMVEKWWAGYDWVIRVNPDVILRDETALLDIMLKDPNATGIFINCRPIVGSMIIHTDFFALKPAALNPKRFQGHFKGNAEKAFTADVYADILKTGGGRWLLSAEPLNALCRAGSGKNLAKSPVAHHHPPSFLRKNDTLEDFVCPIQFVKANEVSNR
mmetsp:Transcript_28330/g.43257  ORF Transcript_28330/g.43257 Transcript_28330/m.43257 type:complete len:338 (+) Transcript_28330:189-1202(+)